MRQLFPADMKTFMPVKIKRETIPYKAGERAGAQVQLISRKFKDVMEMVPDKTLMTKYSSQSVGDSLQKRRKRS
jgi:hypothetical protein